MLDIIIFLITSSMFKVDDDQRSLGGIFVYSRNSLVSRLALHFNARLSVKMSLLMREIGLT